MRLSVALDSVTTTIARTSNAVRAWKTRGAIQVIVEAGGHFGYGEAAPLAGFSPDTIEEAHTALSAFDWPRETPRSLEDVRVNLTAPSARFAAECALASLLASARGVPLWALFADGVTALPIAATLWADEIPRGVSAIKVKIGRHDDLVRLERVRAALPHAELRLDANGADVLSRLDALCAFDPAFVEEPCAFDRLLSLERAPFPIAIDESLAYDTDARLSSALAIDSIRVVVLKPSLHGLLRTIELARRVRATGRMVVVSHLLEGAIARAACAHLALALGGSAPGLGPHPALAPLSRGLTARWIGDTHISVPDLAGLGVEP